MTIPRKEVLKRGLLHIQIDKDDVGRNGGKRLPWLEEEDELMKRST